jgi:uncharacterized protein (TIGR03086 family)
MHDLHPATRTLATLVAAVDDAQLGAPTPCPDYTVGDLLDHIGGLALAFTAAARKEDGPNGAPPPPGDRAHLADDWRERIPNDLATLADAWADADAWEGTTKIAGAEMPAGVVGSVGINEVVAHGWDLARATGQSFTVDAVTLEGASNSWHRSRNPAWKRRGSPRSDRSSASATTRPRSTAWSR